MLRIRNMKKGGKALITEISYEIYNIPEVTNYTLCGNIFNK